MTNLKESFLLFVLIFLCTDLVWASERSLTIRQAPWNQQLAYLQYLVLRTSNINLVRSLSLSTKQRILMAHIAKELDKHVPLPKPHGRMHNSLIEIVKTFEELERVLLAGEAPSEELIKRVLVSRRKEADIIRKGLRYWPTAHSCLRCHSRPKESNKDPEIRPWNDKCRRSQMIITDMDTMHNKALVGYKGIMYLWAAAEEADKVLNSSQRKLVDDFDCCLLPVEDVANPIRVGQIAANNEAIRALEKTRRVPGLLMFWAKKIVTNHMTRYAEMVNPGLTKEQARIMRRRVRSALYKARRLNRVDFELQKHALARELTDVSFSKALSPQLQRYRRALMLFVPGSAKLYAPAAN